MKIGIVTDSSASLNFEVAKKKGIRVVPLSIIMDGVAYLDQVEMTNEMVYRYLDEGKKITTTQPSPQLFLETFEAMRDEGYEGVVCLTMSSGVSGTYQSAMIAKDMVEGIEVLVYDTMTSSFHEEMYVDVAHDLASKEKSLDEIEMALDEIKAKSKVRIMIDDLAGLVLSGRLTQRSAKLGELMKIKPIIDVIDGKLEVVAKIRTKKKAIRYVINQVKEDLALGQVIVHITHIHNPETSVYIKEELEKLSDQVKVKLCEETSPALSIHFGRGAFGVSWYITEEL